MKRFITTLLDTTFDYCLDDVNEFLACNDKDELKSETDDRFWEIRGKLIEMDCDDFWYELEHSKSFGKDSYSPCIILGHCGCWDGKHNIIPVKCDNLYEAVSKCLNNMDDAIVRQNCSTIEVVGLHHDGRNCFDIHLLNDRGVDAYERWNWGNGKADFTKRIYYKTLKDFIW